MCRCLCINSLSWPTPWNSSDCLSFWSRSSADPPPPGWFWSTTWQQHLEDWCDLCAYKTLSTRSLVAFWEGQVLLWACMTAPEAAFMALQHNENRASSWASKEDPGCSPFTSIVLMAYEGSNEAGRKTEVGREQNNRNCGKGVAKSLRLSFCALTMH